VMGAVGAVIGFYVGGPTGAMTGFSVGASIGASMEEVVVQGNKIGDIAKQTSREGVARPIIWGRVRPIGGNLIATSAPNIVKSRKSSGKGGGGTTTTSESVYRTYAIRICEGPITGVIRVWRNNELIYDGRGTAWGAENNPAFLAVATFYNGDWDQMPDPSLEGVFGAGNVPPHRGTAYMVMNNELLDDTGGAVPQWLFEVERLDGQLSTSRPYDIEDINSLRSSGVVSLRDSPKDLSTHYAYSSGAIINSINLTKVMFWVYHTQDPEIAVSNGASVASAQLIYNPTVIVPADKTELINSPGASVVSVLFYLGRIEYNINNENLTSSGATIMQVSLS